MPYTTSTIARTPCTIDHPLQRAMDIKILNKKTDLHISLSRYETKINESTSEIEKELFRALVLCIEKETNADIDYWLMEKRKIAAKSLMYFIA